MLLLALISTEQEVVLSPVVCPPEPPGVAAVQEQPAETHQASDGHLGQDTV